MQSTTTPMTVSLLLEEMSTPSQQFLLVSLRSSFNTLPSLSEDPKIAKPFILAMKKHENRQSIISRWNSRNSLTICWGSTERHAMPIATLPRHACLCGYIKQSRFLEGPSLSRGEGWGERDDRTAQFNEGGGGRGSLPPPSLRTGREAVSHLAGDGTAASEDGPQAAGIAVCECGGGWA